MHFSYELSYLGLFRQIVLLENRSVSLCPTAVSFCWGWELLELLLKNSTCLSWVLAGDSWSSHLYTTEVLTQPMQRGLLNTFGQTVSKTPFIFHLKFSLLFFVCVSNDLFMIVPPSNLVATTHLIKAFFTSCTSLNECCVRLAWTAVMDSVTQH